MAAETNTETAVDVTADGKKLGETAASERYARLRAAFPDRAAFVGEQFIKGHDVAQAKAELADILVTELAAANAQLAATKTESTGHAGVGFSGKSSAKEDADKPTVYPKIGSMELSKFIDRRWEANHEGCQKEFVSRAAFERAELASAGMRIKGVGPEGW